jgi:hypothetical protein
MNKPGGIGGAAGRALKLGWARALGPRCAGMIALTCALAFVSQAVFAYSGEDVLNEPIGTATRRALDLQRSGAQSAPVQPMSGEQAGLAYDRYLNSFSQPIPEFFNSSLKSGGDSGSSANQ